MEQADGAGTDDGHGVPQLRLDVVEGPDRERNRFDERRIDHGDGIGQPVGRKGRHGPVFGEGPITGDSQMPPAHAHVRMAVLATVALAAAPQRVQADLVPDLQIFDPFAQSRDDPRPFMAHDHRDRHGNAAFVDILQDHHIAVADPRRPHLHEDLAGTGFRHRQFPDFERSRLFTCFDNCFHRTFLSVVD